MRGDTQWCSDFRGTNGLWLKYKPISFDEFMTSKEIARVESWRQKCKLNFDLEKLGQTVGIMRSLTLIVKVF